ncbi:MAG TPA: hypothetical protein VFR35_04640 [Actinoplanes sp.]|nr:hypothetical protein [Actinoplanes sp.]
MTETSIEDMTVGNAEPDIEDVPAAASFESMLDTAERDIDAALREANATVRELKKALAAARTGQIRDLRRAVAAAGTAAAALAADTAALGDREDLDEQEYLASGAYVKELLAAAEAHGLTIVEEDNLLLCYPSLLRLLPADAAIEIDKVRERRLRPSVLVAALARAQERDVRFKADGFLDSLRGAYELLVSSEGKRLDGVVRLLDIWAVLTMLPGQRAQYSKQEFARDLYLLDRSGVTRTARSPRTLRWSASTGTKGSGTLVTVAPSGQQQRYWGVSFTVAEPEPART